MIVYNVWALIDDEKLEGISTHWDCDDGDSSAVVDDYIPNKSGAIRLYKDLKRAGATCIRLREIVITGYLNRVKVCAILKHWRFADETKQLAEYNEDILTGEITETKEF